jgi:hypothetical protein
VPQCDTINGIKCDGVSFAFIVDESSTAHAAARCIRHGEVGTALGYFFNM